jgi:predicted nucleic acid-binding protein
VIYLADTNFLLRFVDRSNSLNSVIRSARKKLRANHDELVTTPQNCIELWNVATRPAARNGLGLTPTDAEQMLGLIERLFPLIPDSPAVYPE